MLFIVWSPYSGRSEELARKLNAKIFFIHYFKFKRPIYSIPKYIFQLFATLKILIREKPKLIFVESPPIVAVLSVYLYSKVFAAKYFIDAHSGLFVSWKWKWLIPLQKQLSRKALVTIVTNTYMADIVNSWGAKYYVLPVTLPKFTKLNSVLSHEKQKTIIVINTFSDDEPLGVILEAAQQIQEIKFFITGDITKCPKWAVHNKSNNVIFTNFLPKDKYIEAILNSDAVMVLTTRQNTMQMGAYEAVALERPILISNSELLVSTFNKGCVYVENNYSSIRTGIKEMFNNYDTYFQQITQLKLELNQDFDKRIDFINDMLGREVQF